MSDSKSFNWTKLYSGFLLLICTICLLFIALELKPVAIWATNQNICVSQEIEKSQAPISWGVRKCNGRSKVYQVK